MWLQIRSFLQLPLVLLTVQLRVKVRQPTSWPQVAATCVLMLLPFRSVALLETRARRDFLAECVRQRHLPVPPRPLPATAVPSGNATSAPAAAAAAGGPPSGRLSGHQLEKGGA
jgi:hypothetical protein